MGRSIILGVDIYNTYYAAWGLLGTSPAADGHLKSDTDSQSLHASIIYGFAAPMRQIATAVRVQLWARGRPAYTRVRSYATSW